MTWTHIVVVAVANDRYAGEVDTWDRFMLRRMKLRVNPNVDKYNSDIEDYVRYMRGVVDYVYTMCRYMCPRVFE